MERSGWGGAGDALSGRVDAPGGLDVTDCSVALTDGNTGCIDHCGRVSACWPLQHRSKVNTRCTREGLRGMVTGAPSLPVTRASHSSWEGENTPPKNDTTIAMLIVMGREAVGVGSGGVML